MGTEESPGREQILAKLAEALERLDYVYAMWEGGAIGYGRFDEWSDIDLYVDAEDERIQEVFPAVERALESLSPIELKYEVPTTPAQGYAQAFYRLAGTSKFLLIDLAVIRHSSENKFLESEIHGKASFSFNKNGAVRSCSLDKERLLGILKSRLERIQKRFETFECFIPKEINRKNWIEALDLYRALVLDSLVEALRIKHKPVHHDFKTRYIHYDLPADIVRRLKELYFVKDENDLKEKYPVAARWFSEVIREIDLKEIERRLEKT
ncbi:MAG: hypothetical protein QME66_08900 [Candidatus Eisenbacteria bacterium]|nr:hypothetical protein [Candidatus Eisenbacteria bacterium]